MNKAVATLSSLLLLAGCEQENDLHLNAGHISSIEVIPIEPSSHNQRRQITDRKTISQLTNCLNHAKEKLNKFIPRYKLIFHTSAKVDSAIVNGSSFKMNNARRYIAGCDIERLLP